MKSTTVACCAQATAHEIRRHDSLIGYDIKAMTTSNKLVGVATTKGNAMNKPKWTQDEAIAFECARECITDMIGICCTEIYDEERLPAPDTGRLVKLKKLVADLARERTALTLTDQDKIATIRREYGAQVRAHRAQHQIQAA